MEVIPTEPPTPTLHPNLSEIYSRKVEHLETELNNPDIATEARSVIRLMIDKVLILPGVKRGQVDIELHGELAAVLNIAGTEKNQGPNSRSASTALGGCGGRI